MRWASLSVASAFAAASLVRSVIAGAAETTYFDSIAVPPMMELTPSTWDDEVEKSRWLLVKHFSPYCSHCKRYAPKYQTAYEFYYTSKPAVEHGDGHNFTDFYDFKFGTLDCIAYGDLCQQHQVKLFPTVVLYKNGEPWKTISGDHSIPTLAEVIEKALEETKPGTRPKALYYPEPGQKESPKPDPPSPEEDQDKEGDKKGEKAKETETDKEKEKEKEKPSDKALDKEEDKSSEKPKAQGKHDTKSGEGAAKAKDEKPQKPAKVYNEKGVSVSFTSKTFAETVTDTQDPWLIKFFAPWCPHCQAMAPTWDQLAKAMRGKLNIGEVDCEARPKLCKKMGAFSYPTIVFFKGIDRSDYEGLRGLGDLIQFSERALDSADGVPDVDAASLKALEAVEEVVFVYFYDHATTSEDFAALERLPLSLIGQAKLVKTNDPALYERFKITTWPRLMVSREGRPTYYPPLTPNAMRDTNQVLDWMRSVWLPLVPELTVANSRQIMDRKIVALAVLNREDADSFQSGLREMKSAANEWMDRQIQEFQLERKKLRDAKQMRIEEAEDRGDQRGLRAAKAIRIDMDTSGRKEVGFAWVDGVAWQRWIRTTYGIDVKDGEKIIINDQDRRKYWDRTVTGNYILVSRTSILETLDKVVYNPHALQAKLTVSYPEKILLDFRSAFTDHLYLTLICIALLAYGTLTWYRGRSRPRRGHFRVDSRNVREFKTAEIFGGPNGPKAD
ncbi:Uncharacterized protein ESCO_003043 [Escovopsis weberi]|uniref:Thioredoxin domain-containing protein n=1 Tax=Escovopsis weberi TaxID=150374 RepID=A0A0M8MSA6_ESCWE|nr:Uncharacterized protein ESCO_003043 [Escovopsis weberi]